MKIYSASTFSTVFLSLSSFSSRFFFASAKFNEFIKANTKKKMKPKEEENDYIFLCDFFFRAEKIITLSRVNSLFGQRWRVSF
jgi:hypothetical protein